MTASQSLAERHRQVLDELFSTGRICLRRGKIFDTCPAALNNQQELGGDQRIEGMLLGLAVGDALGIPTETTQPQLRPPAMRDYLNVPAYPSDDTQMSFWTVEQLLDQGVFDFHGLIGSFARRVGEVYGIGPGTAKVLHRHQQRLKSGTPLWDGYPFPDEGHGNGALMRLAPLVLPHLRNPSPQLWVDVTLASFITHNSSAALSSALAFAHLLWKILGRKTGDVLDPEWWLDEYISVASDLEIGNITHGKTKPKGFDGFDGSLCQFLDERVRAAWKNTVSVAEGCSLSGWGSDAAITHTVPTVLYVLMHHAKNFEAALISCLNETKDNDTTAAIVGAILGALHGRQVIPPRWLNPQQFPGYLSNSRNDSGKVFELTEAAVRKFLTDTLPETLVNGGRS